MPDWSSPFNGDVQVHYHLDIGTNDRLEGFAVVDNQSSSDASWSDARLVVKRATSLGDLTVEHINLPKKGDSFAFPVTGLTNYAVSAQRGDYLLANESQDIIIESTEDATVSASVDSDYWYEAKSISEGLLTIVESAINIVTVKNESKKQQRIRVGDTIETLPAGEERKILGVQTTEHEKTIDLLDVSTDNLEHLGEIQRFAAGTAQQIKQVSLLYTEILEVEEKLAALEAAKKLTEERLTQLTAAHAHANVLNALRTRLMRLQAMIGAEQAKQATATANLVHYLLP